MSLSKSKTSSEELQTHNYITVCGICLSAYDVPKSLIPCLHSFCLACIREWATHVSCNIGEGSSQVIQCPNCRKECVLPATGVEGLPTNFFITERDQVDEPPKCNSCEKKSCDIVARCCECGFVCNECMASHKSMRMLKSHSVIMLDALRFGKATKHFSKLQIQSDAVHKNLESGFVLEKTIDLTSIGLSISNVWCCSLQKSGSAYQIAVPTYTAHGKVYMIDGDGKQKMEIDTKDGSPPSINGSPWDVAISSDGRFYVTDYQPWVKVYNKEGRFIHLFQIYNVDGSKFAEARGIAIDKKGQIIVGNVGNKTIGVYRPDESLIKAFTVDLEPYFVALKCQGSSLLISHYSSDHVLETDYSGKILNKILSPIPSITWKPRGVCCADGIIYIANYSTENQCCVYRFTSSWDFTGCITPGLKEPRGISISEDGKLLTVIDSGTMLKIYRRT